MGRVLIVVDDVAAAEGLREMLEPHGDVLLASTGAVRIISRPIFPVPVMAPLSKAERDEPWRRQGKRKGARPR